MKQSSYTFRGVSFSTHSEKTTMKNVFRFFLAACFALIAMIFGIVVMVATGTPHGAFSVSMTLFFALIGAVAGWYRVQ